MDTSIKSEHNEGKTALMKFSILIVLLIFYAMPLASAPTEVIKPYGSEFAWEGKAFRFVGVNICGICHYGKGDILPYTTAGHIDENLDGAVVMGAKVIRLFAPVKFAEHQENVNRLKNVLDKMESRKLKAIVCLTDFYNTGFCPKGDEAYYLPQTGGWTVLDDTWFKSGYKINYLPYAELAVSQLKEHNAIFAWEMGNEMTDLKDPQAIIPFAADVAARIKAIDPHHMVTTGFISVDHTQIGETKGYQLYADANIDFITAHCYNGEDIYHANNRAVHSRLGKPLILEEYGWSAAHGDRANNTQAQVVKWFDQRAARAFMAWGYQAQSYDIGDGDNDVGMDGYHHPDYAQLRAIYSGKAAEIANNPIALPARLLPEGANVARLSTGWKADSVYGAQWGGANVYDGVISGISKWCSLGGAPPHWLAIDLGRERFVNGVVFRFAGAGMELVDYNFKSFQVQTGATLDGPWATDFAVSNPAQFSFWRCLYDTPKTFRCLRIDITDSGIDNYCRLAEIEVYEKRAAAANWVIY